MGQQPPYHNYADAYMGSAKPFVKHVTTPAYSGGPGQTLKLELPTVSRFLYIHNAEHSSGGKNVHIAFYPEGFDNDDFFELHSGDSSPLLEVKCKDIWMRSHNNYEVLVCVFAGCTNIPRENFPDDLLPPTSLTGNRINVLTV